MDLQILILMISLLREIAIIQEFREIFNGTVILDVA